MLPSLPNLTNELPVGEPTKVVETDELIYSRRDNVDQKLTYFPHYPLSHEYQCGQVRSRPYR